MPRRGEKRYHFTYKTICNTTKRYYYGMHSTYNLDDEYLGSGKRLRSSIRKHGKNNHSIQIIKFFDNRDLLKKGEIELITESDLNNPMCMNLQPGGGGGLSSQEHAKKFHAAGGRATCIIIHKRLKNDPEFNKKWHESLNHSNNSFKDKKHSDESKQKMKNTHEKNALQKGKLNSQYGTTFIHNLVLKKNKRVKKEEINYWIDLGWIKGAKFKW